MRKDPHKLVEVCVGVCVGLLMHPSLLSFHAATAAADPSLSIHCSLHACIHILQGCLIAGFAMRARAGYIYIRGTHALTLNIHWGCMSVDAMLYGWIDGWLLL